MMIKTLKAKNIEKLALKFFKLMCGTSLGKICASNHAMNTTDEMSALNEDLKNFLTKIMHIILHGLN